MFSYGCKTSMEFNAYRGLLDRIYRDDTSSTTYYVTRLLRDTQSFVWYTQTDVYGTY